MAVNDGVNTYDMAIEHKLRCLKLGLVDRSGVSEAFASLLTGGGVVAEISTFGLSGLPMDDADEVGFLIDVKSDLWDADLARDMQVELIFTTAKAGAHANIDFKVFAKGFAAGDDLSSPLTSPDVSLTLPAQTVAGQYDVATVKYPLGAPDTFTDDEIIGLVVELDDKGDGAADNLILLGARLWYTAEICDPDGHRRQT